MRRTFTRLSPFALILLLLSGCNTIGEKTASASMIYGVAAALSALLLVGYCSLIKKRDPWYLVLFASIMVVNIGYFALSISRELGEALLANRLSYLGSVFLPLSMLMIILNATHIRYSKYLSGCLLGLAVCMFLIAASPGYLPIYYKTVDFAVVDGVGMLVKEYGPLHILYLIYLLGYFGGMITMIVRVTLQDKIDSLAYATILAIAVFMNLGVWLVEQLVYIPFEMLSISYIISECFLLGLNVLMAEAQKHKPAPIQESAQEAPKTPEISAPAPDPERMQIFQEGLTALTPEERALYDCYVSGMTTDVIMEQLNIKENTLKFHSKNLYGKLGVKSRKELVSIHKQLP